MKNKTMASTYEKTRGTTAKSGGGYTRTSTDIKTGKKTTTTGTLKNVTENEFKSNGKMMRTSTPYVPKGSGTVRTSAVSKSPSKVNKKLY